MTEIAALVADNIDFWTGAIQRKSGAGRGGGKRISLYGIERLRALILDLAVRGKLVPQDAADEPASDLLKKIAKSKATMIRDGVIRKPRDSEGKDHLKQPFSIPNTWQWVRLDQIGAIIGGGTPSSNDAACFADSGTGIAWLTPADLGGFIGRYIDHGARDLTDFGLRSSSATLMPAGSVLFTSRAPIGYVAIAEKPVATNQGFKSVLPFIGDCSLFIATALKSFVKGINDNAPGTTFKEVSGKIVSEIPFPLPPLAEQRRIVAKVDELMALCDALERESADAMTAHQALAEALLATLVNSADAADLARQWARLENQFDTIFTTEASIDALKQTILNLAVRDKLVKPDTSSPVNWIESPLEKLIGPMDSGWSPACHEYPSTSDDVWGVLKTTAVQDMLYCAEQNKELPPKFEPRPDAEARVGDVLITRAGPTNRVGICCFVASTRPRLMISDKIIRFRPISSVIEGAFLALALSVGKAAQQIENAKSGMAASQVNISQSKLKAIIVPVPPLVEQRRIVAKVNALMTLCEALKARLADAAQTQRHLADAITERATA